MTIKQDHNIASATGAVAGALAGGAVGSMAGPVGTIAGAAVGAVVGAKAGDSAAEMANPTDYEEFFRERYAGRPYYSSGRLWSDYLPAYRYGRITHAQFLGRRFEEVEPTLASGWDSAREQSRLSWAEARDAVHDGWQTLNQSEAGLARSSV